MAWKSYQACDFSSFYQRFENTEIIFETITDLFRIQDLHIYLLEQNVLLKFFDYDDSIIFFIINQILARFKIFWALLSCVNGTSLC